MVDARLSEQYPALGLCHGDSTVAKKFAEVQPELPSRAASPRPAICTITDATGENIL
jgi:hypothetical protein